MSERPIPPRPGRGAARRRMEAILRVDHAGELAAVHIYRAQRAVLGAGAGHESGSRASLKPGSRRRRPGITWRALDRLLTDARKRGPACWRRSGGRRASPWAPARP